MKRKFMERRGWDGLAALACLVAISACSPASSVNASGAALAPSQASVELPLETSDTPLAPQAAAAVYGAPESGFPVNTVLELDAPLQPGDHAWDEEGVPAGPLRIVVDIEAQQLYVYRGGVEIGRTFIMYGADDKPTPTGIFPILQKNKDHVSNLYDAPMPYMMRLTWDGIAIHGSEVDDEYATHGCVGIPDEFAALLFEQARLGDRVMITNDWMPETYGSDSDVSST